MRVVLCESHTCVAPKEIKRKVSGPIRSYLTAEEKLFSPVLNEVELKQVEFAFCDARFDLKREIHSSDPPKVLYPKYMNGLFCQIFSFCGVVLFERAGEDDCAFRS